MQTFLTIAKGVLLALFAIGAFLSILALVNFFFELTAAAWLDIRFLRLYLFITVTGILGYILIRFRRKPGE